MVGNARVERDHHGDARQRVVRGNGCDQTGLYPSHAVGRARGAPGKGGKETDYAPGEQANRSAHRANDDYGYSLEIAAFGVRGEEADCASTGCADCAARQASQHQSSDV